MFGSTEELKVKVNSDKDCIQTVSVEWPSNKVKEQIESAFKVVQSQAKVPGFRPGKAPIEMVKKQFQESAFARAQDIMLREGVAEAIKSKKINAVQTPIVQNMKFDPEKLFQFEFQVEVAPQFKMANYAGLKLNKTIQTIKDENVAKTLNQIAEGNAQLVDSKDEAVAGTHHVVVNYEGFLDDKPLEGGKAENFLIDMGAPQTIAGIAEGLLGAKVGEERSVDVTFPENSPVKELANKKAQFKVKLLTIKEKKVPVLDDDFAKDLGFASLNELKDRVRSNLQAEADTATKRDLVKQITTALLADNKFPLPPTLVKDQQAYVESRQRQNMARQGFPLEDQNKILEGAKAELAKQAEEDVRLAYLLNEIATAEAVDVPDEELDKKISEILEQSHPSERKSIEQGLKNGYRDRLKSDIREEKVFEKILSKAKIKEVQGGEK